MNNFDGSVYDNRYFKWHNDNARKYSLSSMKWVLTEYDIHSVVDFGCGIGSYIEAAVNYGLENVKGYEYATDSAKNSTPPHIQKYIDYGTDCTQSLITKQYDCVISIEVAEHIDPSGSDMFVNNIVKSMNDDGVIIFSAAQPNQGGSGHINCQPRDFWINKFNNKGMSLNTDMYNDIKIKWESLGVPFYILNNFFVLHKSS